MPGPFEDLPPLQGVWGIVVEWDEDGLECCRWLELDLYRHGAITKRVEFGSEHTAREYARGVTALTDVILTPRRIVES